MSQSGTTAAFVVVPELLAKPERVGALDGAPHQVFLYEVYDDRAAFELGLRTPRPARVRAGFPALIQEERPVRFASRCHG